MEQPAVSVALDAYSDARYLAEAGKNVLGLNFGGSEFLLINDGSRPLGNVMTLSAWWNQPYLKFNGQPL